MTHTMELLEDLQQTYASQYGLTILFTDESGTPLFPAYGENVLCNALLQQKKGNLLEEVKQSLQGAWKINKPVVYDILPGIQVIVAPVRNNGSKCFLWAGVMVAEQTQGLIKQQLTKNYDPEVPWAQVLQQTPVMTKQIQTKCLKGIAKLAELAALCMQKDLSTARTQLPVQLLQEVTSHPHLEVCKLFPRFLNYSDGFDFFGLAEKQADDKYKVTQITGEGAQSFLGAGFSPGQGFLGRVLLTGKQALCEHAKNDPHSIFFHSFSFYPASVFCEPVKRHDGSLSLFFGGSFSKQKITNEEKAMAKTLAILLEIIFSRSALETENNQQLLRLTSLVDICRLLGETPDTKRVLFLLVDISINLAAGSFSSVIIKEPHDEKIQLISRGEITGGLEAYTEDVAKRLADFSINPHAGTKNPCLFTTRQGERVIECPLFDGNKLIGLLSVGVGEVSESQLEDYFSFLHTLALIGSVSLQMINKGGYRQEEEKVEAFHQAVEEFGHEYFAVSEEAAILSAEFMNKMGMSAVSIKDVIQSCKLSFYSVEFIEKTLPDSPVIRLLTEGRALMENRQLKQERDIQQESKIYALACTYIKSERNLEAVAGLKQCTGQLYQQFVAFIKENQFLEKEFLLPAHAAGFKEKQSVKHTIETKLDLSPREKEVLGLVIDGYNNREISEELFISEHTVKNHVTKIFQKLAVSDRAGAVSKVYQLMYEDSAVGQLSEEVMKRYNLNEEWLDLVNLAVNSNIDKQDFAAFLEAKRKETYQKKH